MDATKFQLGRLVATPAALTVLQANGMNGLELVARHLRGDWGDVDEHDRQANDRALTDGTRLLSAYVLPNGERMWVITEADRSATTLLLPADY